MGKKNFLALLEYGNSVNQLEKLSSSFLLPNGKLLFP